jgi:hypothetical protein
MACCSTRFAVLVSGWRFAVFGYKFPDPRYQPDGNNNNGAEKEITHNPFKSIKTQIVQTADKTPEAINNVKRIDAEERQEHANNKADDRQSQGNSARRASKKIIHIVLPVRGLHEKSGS